MDGGSSAPTGNSDLQQQYAAMQSLYAQQQQQQQQGPQQQAYSNMAQYIAMQTMSMNPGLAPLSAPPQMSLATLVPGGQSALGEEPLYVNAKQYHRIVKRREARTRQEALYKAAKKEKAKEVAKGYIHESRHKHAMRRPRGPGGRFLSASEMAALDAKEKAEGLQTSGGGTALSFEEQTFSHLVATTEGTSPKTISLKKEKLPTTTSTKQAAGTLHDDGTHSKGL